MGFSTKAIAIYIILWIYCISCQSDHMKNKANTLNPLNSKSFTYLALGDSYTIGEGVDSTERWPVQLVNELKKNGLQNENLTCVAKTGWTTRELRSQIDKEVLEEQYDLVTLLIGVNNQYRGQDTGDYRREFRELLDLSINFAGQQVTSVIVVSIPDYSVTPFASEMDKEKIAREIDAFNAINLDETQKTGAGYVNVTAISRLAENDNTLLAEDGLHPSGKMYGMWVEKILPIAREILKAR
jgi:lysophospholipase L1-like esterase